MWALDQLSDCRALALGQGEAAQGPGAMRLYYEDFVLCVSAAAAPWQCAHCETLQREVPPGTHPGQAFSWLSNLEKYPLCSRNIRAPPCQIL